MADTPRARTTPTAGRIASILGLDTPAGAYLARLLLARGYRVAGTAAGPTAGLAKLGVVSEVALYPDAVAALTTSPAEVYDLRGPGPARTGDTATLLTLLDGRPARLFSAGPGPAPDDATALIEQARDNGMFAVTGRLFAHESRLHNDSSPVARIVAAIAAGVAPAAGDLATAADYGWTAEYVDPMWRLLQQLSAADVVIATGRLLSGGDVARYAAEYFGREVALPSDIEPAVTASAGDPAATRQALGWSATTWGRDLVRLLCEGVAGQA